MKKLVMMMAVIMMVTFTVAGCKSKKQDETSAIEVTLIHTMDDGSAAGGLRWTRYGFYGSRAYEAAVDSREYRKSQGEVVTEVSEELIYGETYYYFRTVDLAG